MTKEEYVLWVQKDPKKWTGKECREADALVKRATLEKLHLKLQQMKLAAATLEYVELCVRAHFGSAETDEFLKSIDAYPEWIK